MSLARARVLPAGAVPAGDRAVTGARGDDTRPDDVRARRLSREILEARAEAERIVADATERAARLAEDAARVAATDARESELARLAAGFLALRAEEARRAERDLDRVMELSVVLAERLVGEALRVEPARVADLARAAIREARGARRVRLACNPDDAPALADALGPLGPDLEVEADDALGRGSIVVHTDIGGIDARLEPQLARLAAALREALS